MADEIFAQTSWLAKSASNYIKKFLISKIKPLHVGYVIDSTFCLIILTIMETILLHSVIVDELFSKIREMIKEEIKSALQ